ncbi:MAG: hypothetical protein Q8N98_04690 [bacterium]|nr:hypothetical protein [bacterium]
MNQLNPYFQKLFAAFAQNALWATVKSFFVIGLFLYIIFAMIVVRQVSLLSTTIGTDLSPRLKFLSVVHLLASIVVFFAAIFLF